MNYLFAAPTIAFTAGDRVVDQVQDRPIIPIRLYFAGTLKNPGSLLLYPGNPTYPIKSVG